LYFEIAANAFHVRTVRHKICLKFNRQWWSPRNIRIAGNRRVFVRVVKGKIYVFPRVVISFGKKFLYREQSRAAITERRSLNENIFWDDDPSFAKFVRI